MGDLRIAADPLADGFGHRLRGKCQTIRVKREIAVELADTAAAALQCSAKFQYGCRDIDILGRQRRNIERCIQCVTV